MATRSADAPERSGGKVPKARRSRPQGPARGWESQGQSLGKREAQINAAPDGTRKGNFRTSRLERSGNSPSKAKGLRTI